MIMATGAIASPVGPVNLLEKRQGGWASCDDALDAQWHRALQQYEYYAQLGDVTDADLWFNQYLDDFVSDL